MRILPDFSPVPARLPAFVAASLAFGIGSAQAANISLIADGSFSAATGWSNGAAPSAGNNYSAGNFNVLTAFPSSANFTFGGDNLTIGSGTGLLALRTTGIVTVNDLRLNSGGVQNWGGTSTTLAGAKITVTGYGQIAPSVGRTINITSSIEGSGQLRVKAGKVVLSGFNTYSGGTVVQTDATYPSWLEVNGPDTLGTGDVTVQSGSKLTLIATSPTNTTNIIGDGASLILPTGLAAGSVALSFSDSDRINKLSLDGGTTWVIPGTWGSLTSSATHKNAVFTGTGILAVGANTVTNGLGDSFSFNWSEEFNASSASWPEYQSGTSYSQGNMVMTPYKVGSTIYNPRVQSLAEKRFGRYEAVIYTDTPEAVCNAFYIVKPGAPPNFPVVDWQEIDILEIWDIGGIKDPQQNTFWGSTRQYQSASIRGAHLADGWHTWTMDWTPNNILVYLDGQPIATKPSDSFNNPSAKLFYPMVVHFSNWVINTATFSNTPASLMLVDRFAYYALQHDNRLASAYNAASGVSVSGSEVSGLDTGDHLRYNAVDTAKYRNLTLEIACGTSATPASPLSSPQIGYSGRIIQVRSGSASGTILATVPVPYTGPSGDTAYNRFTQVSANLPNVGTVDLYLTFVGGTNCGTLRELRFHGNQPSSNSRDTLIEAWNVDGKSSPGPAINNGDYVSGLNGGARYPGFYLRYNNINFSGLTSITLELGYNGSVSPAKHIYLRTGGPTGAVIGTLAVPNTGGYRKFNLLNVPISTVTGTTDLYLTFSAADCGNLRSLRFPR